MRELGLLAVGLGVRIGGLGVSRGWNTCIHWPFWSLECVLFGYVMLCSTL